MSTHNPGERVALINKVVSKVYDGYFYIQDSGRAGGVRVTSSRAFNPGDVVCVQGLISLENGENVIDPTYLTLADTVSKPNPVFVNSSALWGESGLSVNGLLVRVVGKVGTDQGNGTFSLTDDSGTKVIYVKTNGVTMPAQNTFVAVTAVATNSEGTPLLLLADGQDIQVIQ